MFDDFKFEIRDNLIILKNKTIGAYWQYLLFIIILSFSAPLLFFTIVFIQAILETLFSGFNIGGTVGGLTLFYLSSALILFIIMALFYRPIAETVLDFGKNHVKVRWVNILGFHDREYRFIDAEGIFFEVSDQNSKKLKLKMRLRSGKNITLAEGNLKLVDVLKYIEKLDRSLILQVIDSFSSSELVKKDNLYFCKKVKLHNYILFVLSIFFIVMMSIIALITPSIFGKIFVSILAFIWAILLVVSMRGMKKPLIEIDVDNKTINIQYRLKGETAKIDLNEINETYIGIGYMGGNIKMLKCQLFVVITKKDDSYILYFLPKEVINTLYR